MAPFVVVSEGQATVRDMAALCRNPLWLCWEEPGEVPGTIVRRPPFRAVAALAARLAAPGESDLRAPSLAWGAPSLPVRGADHVPETHRLAGLARRGVFPHDLVVLYSFSALAEEATAVLTQTLPPDWGARAVDAARLVAAAHLGRVVWDLSHGPCPLLATCWETERLVKGQVAGSVVAAPPGVLAQATVFRAPHDPSSVKEALWPDASTP